MQKTGKAGRESENPKWGNVIKLRKKILILRYF